MKKIIFILVCATMFQSLEAMRSFRFNPCLQRYCSRTIPHSWSITYNGIVYNYTFDTTLNTWTCRSLNQHYVWNEHAKIWISDSNKALCSNDSVFDEIKGALGIVMTLFAISIVEDAYKNEL